MQEKVREITFTKVALPYGWLGNMSPHPIRHLDREWRTSEALFQALRFDDEQIRELIRSQKGPMGAKMAAKGRRDRMVIAPMSEADVENMRVCLRLKLDQHPRLKQKLLDISDARIIEDASARGRSASSLFWGAVRVDGGWEGKNMLGELWMKCCEELFAAKQLQA
jgi:predicted NAD-dependent protein-ADP-ribosyltransferase YbiA (DUF1768 family)